MFAPKVSTGQAALTPLARAVVYGVAGCVGELFFTACTSTLRTHRLRPHTSPMMLPVYALIQPLFEPAHRIMRGRVPLWGRALVYGSGFHAAEYLSGGAGAGTGRSGGLRARRPGTTPPLAGNSMA